MKDNIVKHNFQVSRKDRNHLKKHDSFLLWFTGLSGSGKSSIANAVESKLFEIGIHTYVLDGDNIRQGLNKDLSFSSVDRTENIRRIAETANLLVDSGIVVIASFISPYLKDRENIKEIIGADNYLEVYISTSLEECERRDVKGLYKKARKGEIKSFTGISAPYEVPVSPSIVIDTEEHTIDEAANLVIENIKTKLNKHE